MDRQLLLRQIRELIELDRGFGVEFVMRRSVAVPTTALPATALRPPVLPAPRAPVPSPVAPPAPSPVVQPAATPAILADPHGVRVATPVERSATTVAASAVPAADVPAVPGAGAMAETILGAIARAIAACTACGLCTTRRSTVPGEGAARPALVFIGEGPGAEEDAQGRPFVGPAGQLLDKMIIAMGLARQEVFITNVVKCRPPGNRNPEPTEVLACSGFLEQQLASLAPQVICTLGNVPLRALFGAEQPGITRSHGQILTWRGITVIPTFHPSYLLRNEQAKKPAWEDLQVVLKSLGRTAPRRGAAT